MTSPMRPTLDKLLDRRDLEEDEAGALLRALTDAATTPAFCGATLAALRVKGVTAPELRGFARAMRSLARRPRLAATVTDAIDIVGTGGDGSGSVNLSTGSALLAAACGLDVVKHGNRSVSSRAGSADVLEALGVPLPLDEEAAGECLAATGFTFLFAPHYHPAMKAVAPVRAALGVRTVFNILGPLTNPAEPPYHLIGAYSLDVARLMADALAGMSGVRRAFVVHGARSWDEPTTLGPFALFDVHNGAVVETLRDPRNYGLAPCEPQELAGEDAAFNARALRHALTAPNGGPLQDCLVLGAGLALEIAGRAPDLGAGIALARAAIADGSGHRVLERLAARAHATSASQ